MAGVEARRQSIETPPDLNSSSNPLSEELQCSVCLDVFTDPVTIPCGHNFCKRCLNQCWEKSEYCTCPFCKEIFSKRPDLKINTALRQVAQLFKEKSDQTTSEVLCDFCNERKLKALKSCLICQSSYCEIHLEPHYRVLRLKKHKLINAVENLEDYICQKHERPLELFCRDDQMCVCLSCTEGDHKNHNNVPLEEESVEKKTQILVIQGDVKMMIKDRMKKIQDMKHLAELRKVNLEKEKAESIEIFSEVQCSIQRCQSELMEMMEQKAEEKQDEKQIEALDKEITELKRRDGELEKLSHTEDHLHLLQIYPSLCNPFSSKQWSKISINTPVSLNSIRTALTQLQQTLDKKLTETELQWIALYAVDVTLDSDTAHSQLILSDDGKQVSCGNVKRDVPDNPKRFDCCLSVLGKEGFSSGRSYFEVQVRNKTNWNLGLARESAMKKGKITQSPQNGYWSIRMRNGKNFKTFRNEYVAFLRVKPQKVGVFVDYEEGLVSFYEVVSKSHIYTFTGQTFTEKLYPYLCPLENEDGKNSKPLIISNVKYKK